MSSLQDFLDDVLYIWMRVWGGGCISKRDGKIVRANEENVCQKRRNYHHDPTSRLKLLTNAINSSDLLNVFHSFPSLDLHKDRDILVCRVQILRRRDTPTPVSKGTTKSASSSWRKSAVGYNLLRLLGGGNLQSKYVL
jgi:hypothetical protein